MFYATVLSLFGACAYVAALPLTKRVVYSPPITSPDARTTWTAGSAQTVTWDISDVPQNITSPTGMLVLGYLQDGEEGLHLMLDEPLADDFDLTDGKVEITVPEVDPKTTYIVVLFGDSGNKSPEFTITSAGDSPSSAAGSASASSSAEAPTTTLLASPTSSVSASAVDITTTVIVSAASSSAAEVTSEISSAASSPSSESIIATTVSVAAPTTESSASQAPASTVIVDPSSSASDSDSASAEGSTSEEDNGDAAFSLSASHLGLTIPVAVMLACLLR